MTRPARRLPRAVGRRTPYAAVPEHIRTWVDHTLGSPVVAAHDQRGGMSPGCATRLVCADGQRAFVKAVGAASPEPHVKYRREVLALSLLGSHPLWADLVAAFDDDEWLAVLLEDVDGDHPDLASDPVMERVCAATDELGAVLAARVPEPPTTPPPGDGGLADTRAILLTWAQAFEHLDDIPDDLLPRWVRTHAHELHHGVRALCDLDFDRLVHWDIRDDNLLVRPAGEIVFFDWGGCGRGPDWLDPLLARWDRVDERWFDTSIRSSPALTRLGDEAVTAAVVGFGVRQAWRCRPATSPGPLRDYRRTQSERLLRGAARRLGI